MIFNFWFWLLFLELKLCFDPLAFHIDSGHAFVPEAKLRNKMSTKNLKIKCPNEFALMNTIEWLNVTGINLKVILI